MNWAKLMTDLRRESGLSQRALSIRAGVNRSTVRRLEKGDARGDIVSIERILAALGYEIDVMPALREAA